MERLSSFVQTLGGEIDALVEIKQRLGLAPAVLTNWKTRGVSKEGALEAEGAFGCSAHWLLTGAGRMKPQKWPFALLTPEVLASLSPKQLEIVEKGALNTIAGMNTLPASQSVAVDTIRSPSPTTAKDWVNHESKVENNGTRTRVVSSKPSRGGNQ